MCPYATEKLKRKRLKTRLNLVHYPTECEKRKKCSSVSTFKCFAKYFPPLSDPGHCISNNRTSNRTQTSTPKPERVILPTN